MAESEDPTMEMADLLEGLPDAVVVADDSGRIIHANPAVGPLLGRAPHELTGQPLTVLMPQRLRQEHAAGFDRFFLTHEPRLIGTTVQVPALHANGREVSVDLTLSVLTRSGRTLVIGVLRDARPQLQLEQQLEVRRYLEATLHVTQTLGSAPSAAEAFERLLPTLCERLDWDAASLWVPSGTTGTLSCAGLWNAPGEEVPALHAASLGRTFGPGEGLPGLVWAGRAPVVMTDLWHDPRFPRAQAARAEGILMGIAFPVMRGESVLAVCELFSRRARLVPDELLDVVSSAGRQLGQFLGRLSAESQARELAVTLQRSLLPPQVPLVPGVEVAARFRAGGDGLLVGGDTYDVMRLTDGRWMMLIADVCGKGALAATVTAQARYTARAAAEGGAGPTQVLAAINAALLHDEQADPLPFLTACCLVVQPHDGGMTGVLSVAGHPLPLLRRSDGSVEEVGTSGLLLGVDPEATHTAVGIELGAGDMLVLFTDGVTEARDQDGNQFGDDRLSAVLGESGHRGAEATVQALVDAVARHVLASTHGRDDMAVLAIRC
ncbi:MAG: SpoIIE family protein phosphatase [Pedococcus sp.]